MAKDYDYLDENEEGNTGNEADTLKGRMLPREEWDISIDPKLRRCTKALFIDFRHACSNVAPPPFTLKPFDVTYEGKKYRSMYLEYMKYDSEYEAAMAILGSWAHWSKLKKTKWFKEVLDHWEEERNIRDEAIARSVLISLAEGGNVTAARTIYTNSNDNKPAGAKKRAAGQREGEDEADTLKEMMERLEDA
jgi:hypothetical protein